MLKKQRALFIWNSPSGLFFYALNKLTKISFALEYQVHFLDEKQIESYKRVLLESIAVEKCCLMSRSLQRCGLAVSLQVDANGMGGGNNDK